MIRMMNLNKFKNKFKTLSSKRSSLERFMKALGMQNTLEDETSSCLPGSFEHRRVNFFSQYCQISGTKSPLRMKRRDQNSNHLARE